MDLLPGLIASVLSWLHQLGGPDLCPGPWAWSTTALGALVGLVPALGALAVAVLRRRIGPGYPAGSALAVVGIGVVCAGLIPWAVFDAAGTVFQRVAAGRPVPGLSRADLLELSQPICLLDSQASYLGGISTADAFGPSAGLWLLLALLVLLPMPVLVALFVMVQARTALRRGRRWPSRFFWMPVLVVAFATGPMPAGSTGQLWLGAAVGSFFGMFVVPVVAPPPRTSVGPAGEAARQRWWRPKPERPAARPAVRAVAAGPPLCAKPRTLLGPALAATPGPVPGAAAIRHPSTQEKPAFPVPAAARFTLLRQIGVGGFGGVWLASDAKLGTLVALKAAHAPDAETEERIRREARALATVRHPNCVRIHDLVHAGSDRGLAALNGLVIVMDCVDGPSLGEIVLGRGPLNDIAAARIWAGLAGALAAAHGCGVLHRDIKPGNVVLDRSGVPHLIDFGIARSRGDATLTATGFVLGTPDFLAPEVARGEPATPGSDAWQLAATVSFGLTGFPPRGGHEDAVSGLRAAAAGMAPTHLPARSAHHRLLRSALTTDPWQRPTLDSVRAELEGWLRRAGEPVAGPIAAAVSGLAGPAR